MFNPWVRKIFWRRTWQPTPVFLPGESRGQRSLTGYYSPWGHKESDITEQLTLSLSWIYLLHSTVALEVYISWLDVITEKKKNRKILGLSFKLR